MSSGLPTRPKRGALSKRMRRSFSWSLPVISACSGALKSGAPGGASCTSPSVIMMAPPMRDGGTSRKAPSSAPNSRVSVRSSAASDLPASTTRTSNCLKRPRRCCSPASASSVCLVRSPISWLWLRSTISATTLFSGSRSSLRNTGLNSAAASASRATKRRTPPRWRNHRPTSASSASGTSTRASNGQEISGSKEIDQFMRYCPSRSSRMGTCTWSDL